MSATATFEFKTNLSAKDVLTKLQNLWYGKPWYRVDLISSSKQGNMLCHLAYILGNPEEKIMLNAALNYLFSISQGSKIYYYRSFDTITETVDYPKAIFQKELFDPALSPGDYDGIQYRYLIRQDNK